MGVGTVAQEPDMVDEFSFVNDSEMGELIRAFDWATTTVGKVESWSSSLRMAVSICLESAFPMLICWGTELVQFYNDPYIQILGSKHPQSLGQRMRDCWSEVWETLDPIVRSIQETGKAVKSLDMRFIIHRYGYDEETYFSVSYSTIRDEIGQSGGILCTVTETTERVLAERRLRTLRELAVNTTSARTIQAAGQAALDTLASNGADIPFALLYLLNTQQTIAQRLSETGLAADSLLNLATVDCRQDVVGVWALAKVMQTLQPQFVSNLRSEFGLEAAQPELPNTALILPIAAQTQEGMTGFLVVGLSPYLLLNEEYRGFLDLVAGQVATSIANARAYEEAASRVEALAELNRAKTTFFSNVSHEFRTPLTLMLSPLEETLTELEGILPAKARSQLEMVQRNGTRLLKLVNTLLDFSRIEAGRTQANYEPTDLAKYTAELASIFRSAVEQAGLQLTIDCPLLPSLIYVDREMWEKIVLNLLSNAFKFTFEGEINVSVRPFGDRVELVVRDTGTGIPADEIPRLFERFHRVAGARGRTFEGTGIGLSLVQELVHLHGGAIAVESTLDEGSAFTVGLPSGTAHLPSECLRQGEAQRINKSRTQTSTVNGAMSYVEEALGWLPEEGTRDWGLGNREELFPSPSSARILLVDDNADMRNYLHRILSQFYEVDVVSDGETALVSAHKRMPDLVLSDVMMPGIDGFELLRQLRADPKTSEIPILLLSARAGEESAVEGLKTGADDYLVKPFSTRELLARVAANLELRRSRQAAARHRIDSDRKQAEVAFRRSEERYRTLFESIDEGFCVIEMLFDENNTPLDYRFLEINPAFEKQTGLEQAEGKTARQLAPDLEDHWFEIYGKVALTGEPVRFENGSEVMNRWFDVYAFRVGEPESRKVAILFKDVTERKRIEDERKQAEVALRESEERFRNMADNAPFMVWVTDPTGYCTYLSQSWYDFTGQTEETGLGLGWLDVVHPEDCEYSRNIFLEANKRGDAFRLEYRLRRKDGEYRSCIDAGSPWFGGDGQFKGYIGSVIDISERKQMEEALQLGLDRLDIVIEGAQVGLWYCDLPLDKLVWNDQCKTHFGLPPDTEVSIDTFYEQLHPDDRERVQRVVGDAIEGRANYDVDYRTVAPNGQMRWIRAVGRVTYDVNQIPKRFDGITIDITEHKRQVEEREHLLRREQSAREQAESANRIKDEFLAVLSHELRTPLNPILGWTSFLRKGSLDAAKTAYALETIERNAKLQVQLIEDLLDISRILRGKLSLNVMPVDLSAAISAALETVRLAAQAKSLQIQTTISPTVGTISGDAGRLQQVLWNLLSNAVKFTPQGGQITIALTIAGTHAQIQVTDTGIGINPDFLPYIFEHFRQEDGATTRKFGGLGLGLAIARQIVEMHGGTVQAESPGVGKGATFTVKLPLLGSRELGVGSREDNSASLPIAHSPLMGLRVLVVDDEVDTRELIAFVLEQAGAIVTSVPSALAALEVIAQSKPAVLLSDIGMPEMDGYMLMQHIRAMSPSQQISAIALTAFAGESDRQLALRAGFQKHISKPIEPDMLVQAIASLIGN
ncbi:ATP-binding protein [Scytonema sp. NUACC26]|uniref:ATP-binding protein n=1 Tax=Scytonema sp. NUACC26 TaxID=3140176 RepID=UPI0034DBE84A